MRNDDGDTVCIKPDPKVKNLMHINLLYSGSSHKNINDIERFFESHGFKFDGYGWKK